MSKLNLQYFMSKVQVVKSSTYVISTVSQSIDNFYTKSINPYANTTLSIEWSWNPILKHTYLS